MCLCVFAACNNSTQPVKHDSIPAKDTPEAVTAETAPPIRDSLQIPVYEDSTRPVKLINISIYHDDEISPNTSNMEWTGIFQNSKGYYAALTPLRTERVKDEVLDEDDGRLTGWQVLTDNPDTSLVLVTSNAGINAGPLDVISDEPVAIGAGSRVDLDYKGVHYMLYAVAQSYGQNDVVAYVNYKLYLKTTRNGKEVTQLLGATPYLDDVEGMYLLLAGDLDGDGLLDFLLDTSYHYNVTAPSLYLSKPAESGKALKLTAVHYSVGC